MLSTRAIVFFIPHATFKAFHLETYIDKQSQKQALVALVLAYTFPGRHWLVLDFRNDHPLLAVATFDLRLFNEREANAKRSVQWPSSCVELALVVSPSRGCEHGTTPTARTVSLVSLLARIVATIKPIRATALATNNSTATTTTGTTHDGASSLDEYMVARYVCLFVSVWYCCDAR